MRVQIVSRYLTLSQEGLVSKVECPMDQGLLMCNQDINDEIFLYCLSCSYKKIIGYEYFEKIRKELISYINSEKTGITMAEENNEIQDIGHDLSKNIEVVNYIMLHRIYDVLLLMAKKTVGVEEVDRMVKYHDQGFLLGPEPSFTPSEENNEK